MLPSGTVGGALTMQQRNGFMWILRGLLVQAEGPTAAALQYTTDLARRCRGATPEQPWKAGLPEQWLAQHVRHIYHVAGTVAVCVAAEHACARCAN
jgi:hypothetical protein